MDSFLSFFYDNTLGLVVHVSVFETLHCDLIALEDAPDFLHFLNGNFQVVSLLEDKCLELNISELFVERLEELL